MQIDIVKRKNFSFNFAELKKIEIKDNTFFEECNFTQAMPFTEIFKNKKNLIFRDCNLVNCKLPTDSTTINCNKTQISFCSNDSPEIEKYGLAKCTSNCDHISTWSWIAGIFHPSGRKYESQIIEE